MADNTDKKVLLSDKAATGAGDYVSGISGSKTYQAAGTTTSGTGAATIVVQGSNDAASWDTIGTITLTLGTAATSDGFTSSDRYFFIRGNVTALSGTGASVDLTMAF